jgi:hypothetical protein
MHRTPSSPSIYIIQSLLILYQSGLTPLHYAVLKGHEKIVSLFLEAGADIEAVDKVCTFVRKYFNYQIFVFSAINRQIK